MPRSKKSRTDYRPDDVDQLYTDGHISYIARSGGFPDTDLDDLSRHLKSALRAYLELVEEEAKKQKERNRQTKERERRGQKNLAFNVYDSKSLPRRTAGRPREGSMRALIAQLGYIYHRHSKRDPKAKSCDRRPDDKFDEFAWAACNPLFEHSSLDHFIRAYEKELKKKSR